jgi:hypothetical protein
VALACGSVFVVNKLMEFFVTAQAGIELSMNTL